MLQARAGKRVSRMWWHAGPRAAQTRGQGGVDTHSWTWSKRAGRVAAKQHRKPSSCLAGQTQWTHAFEQLVVLQRRNLGESWPWMLLSPSQTAYALKSISCWAHHRQHMH
eukprot:scaffold120365_cov24-Tisochrysis_lutea.AAC.1